ncbi:unnamed protein product [Mytilus coruscus]|uniref:Uncharacterized protein n=1 Tax=Mytilus coruscus TaxID=42192 RepID=A0A6J8EKX7_MYTCO|nr:unnamed protein product [Mytilus coruscus]
MQNLPEGEVPETVSSGGCANHYEGRETLSSRWYRFRTQGSMDFRSTNTNTNKRVRVYFKVTELSNGGIIHSVSALLLDFETDNMALNSITFTSISDGIQSLDKKEVTYTKSFTLNIEKSLTKKLNSAKRNQISYKCTGGGFTAELDAVTFELFLNACEIYYSQSTQTFSDVKTDVSLINMETQYKEHTKYVKIRMYSLQ